MSESVVRVDLRQASLSESARLRDAGELLFLAIDNPPPVRCLLHLRNDDGVDKAFEVARVVEVVDEEEAARGCYGREVPLERLDEQVRVGSEHLEPGITSGGGVPAPVVMMNTSEMMLGEAGEAGDDHDGGEGEGESEESDEGESEESGEGESEESGEGESSEGESEESGEGESEESGEGESDEESDEGSDDERSDG